jgi:hypothetical protein
MRKASTKRRVAEDPLFARKRRQIVPHEFALDALAPLAPDTRSMFGCLAVYVEDKIVLILRDRKDWRKDNGVWLATTAEHHDSLRQEFPTMRSIQLFGREVTHWQVLPADTPDFEEATLRACRLIRAGDPRIGKVPKRKRAKRPLESSAAARQATQAGRVADKPRRGRRSVARR